MPAAGSAYYAEFCTSNPATGAAANADSTPVAMATRNGTDDATFTLTITNLATGRYKVTGTVPAGYADGDQVQVSVAATVAGVAGVAIVDAFTVDVLTSTRSTYSGGAVASVTAAVTVGDYIAGEEPLTAGDVQAALTAQGYTTGRATNLDNLDVPVSDPVVLAEDGLDALDVASPAGPAATFREMVVQLHRRFFAASAKDAAAGTITTFAEDGTTPVTVQAYTEDVDGSETLGPST